MRKFSYEEYKAGNAVQTRDGKHRVEAIHRFDEALGPRVVACVNGYLYFRHDDGRLFAGRDNPGDLVMKPVVHKAWVVVRNGYVVCGHASEAKAKCEASYLNATMVGHRIHRVIEVSWEE